MAAGTTPIFPIAPIVGLINGVLTVNTTKDLTSGTIFLVATGGTNGTYIEKLVAQPDGTNVATVMRIWVNNGGVTSTAANNAMIKDATMPATTNSEVAAIGNAEIPLNIAIPSGYRLYVTLGTGVAAGFHVTAFGGDF